MEYMEIVSKTMRHIAWGFVWNSVLAVVCGVLIFMYPALLGMLVGVFLVMAGIVSFCVGMKVFKYSKIQIKI